MNENGQRLLELCCYHNLCITNTFFQNKAYHKVSWRHRRLKHWHQLDLTRRDSINIICNTRSYHSADCDTDHSLIASKVKIRPKKFYHSKHKGQPRINVRKTAYPDKNHVLRNTIYSSALLTYGKKERKSTDWLEHYITEMEPVITDRRNALIDYKRDSSQKNLQALRAACQKAQQTARRCANDYWLQLSECIE